MNIETLPATFEGQTLDIYNIHGEQWLGGAQIGHALGYMTSRHAIGKIHKRNADEFGPDDTIVIDLPTGGGLQSTRIFSHKGIVKLAMFAKTPKAAAFRDWAARVLTTPQTGMSSDVVAEVQRAWLSLPINCKIVRYAHLPLSNREIAKLAECSAGTVFNRRKTAQALGLLPVDSPPPMARHVQLKRLEA